MAELSLGSLDPWAHQAQGEGSGRPAALLRGIHGVVSTHLLFDSVTWEKPATCLPPLCSSPRGPSGVHNPALPQPGTLYSLPASSSVSQSLQPG